MGKRDKPQRNTKTPKARRSGPNGRAQKSSDDTRGNRLVLWAQTSRYGRADWRIVADGESHEGALIVCDSVPDSWRVRQLPPNALPGDLSKQNMGMSGGFPAYVDLKYTCRICGAEDVFPARAQRFWYETLGKHCDSGAIHCQNCRAEQRTIKRAQRALTVAQAAYDAEPTPENGLAVATAIAIGAPKMGRSALQRALGHARKAKRAGLKADDTLRTIELAIAERLS